MTSTRTVAAVGALVALSGLGLAVSSATAAPPEPQIAPHRHYVVTSDDGRLVPVGPNSCERGPSVQFDNFHLNGHLGPPGQHGVVVGRGCTFVPPN